MIKLLLPVAILFLFSSCSKEIEYTCKCDSIVKDASTGTITNITQNISYVTKHKSDAVTKCQVNGTRINSMYTNSMSAATNCAIQ